MTHLNTTANGIGNGIGNGMGNGVRIPDMVNCSRPNGVSVLIVGSGIGGLSAARECVRIGCLVRVLERRSQPALTGGSFTVGPSALRSLSNYPRLQREVKQHGSQPAFRVYRLDGSVLRGGDADGGPLKLTDLLSASVARDSVEASDILRLSRPKLYRSMIEHLDRLGVQVEYGRDVVDYFERVGSGGGAGAAAGVVFSDGSRLEADIVIAADGVNGHSWKLVLGREVRARPSGDAIFRTSFPVENVLGNPVIAEKFGLGEANRQPMMHIFMGDMQLLSVVDQEVVEWGLVHKDDGRAQESWDDQHHHESVAAAVQALVDRHPDLCEAARALIAATPADSMDDWRITWRDPQPQWTSAGGCVVQLGDAAHTFHPSSGNGATQAMEDAVSLAACISISVADGGKDNLPWATRVHNLLRFERVSCLQAFGIANQAERVKSGKLPSFGRWILCHDAEKYAREQYAGALESLQNGTPFKNTNTPPGMVYEPWTIDNLLAEKDGEVAAVLRGDWS